MGWARIDDGFHDHPKVDALSLEAVGLWTLCLTWAHRHRSTATHPGFIPEARVRKLSGRRFAKVRDELTSANLWELAPGGYTIHDFQKYLPKQRDPAERAQAGRKGAQARWQPDRKPDGKLPSKSMATDGSRASARAFPTRPVPTEPLRGSAATPPADGDETPNQRANRLAKSYTDRQPMSRFPAIAGIVRKAITAGKTDPEITDALIRLAAENRPLTVETLRIEIEGLPPQSHQRPSTTDQRVQAGLDLAAEFARREAEAEAEEHKPPAIGA